MNEIAKYLSLVMVAVFLYSLPGVATYKLAEHMWPEHRYEHDFGVTAVFWPVGLPALGAIYVVRAATREVDR